jgi:hypothetical protein
VPSGAATPSPGLPGSSIVATTVLVAGSRRVTVLSPTFMIQSAPLVEAKYAGACRPVTILVTAFVAGSIRANALVIGSLLPIQTAPKENSSPAGAPPVRIVRTTRLPLGLMRETVPARLLDAQTAPPPNATSQTLRPTRIRRTRRIRRGSTRSTVEVP